MSHYMLFDKHDLLQPRDRKLLLGEWGGVILTERHEKEEKSLQCCSTDGIYNNTCLHTIQTKSQNKTLKKDTHTKSILALWLKQPYNSWRHAQNNEYKGVSGAL